VPARRHQAAVIAVVGGLDPAQVERRGIGWRLVGIFERTDSSVLVDEWTRLASAGCPVGVPACPRDPLGSVIGTAPHERSLQRTSYGNGRRSRVLTTAGDWSRRSRSCGSVRSSRACSSGAGGSIRRRSRW
jgi:hypothetical protein